MAFTIPARAIRRIEGNVLLAIDKQQAAMVTADGTTITSRLIDGTYPNVQQLIPDQLHHTLTCERKQLLHALERVAVIGDIIKLTAAKQSLLSPQKPMPAVALNPLQQLARSRPVHSMPPTSSMALKGSPVMPSPSQLMALLLP
jgi:hypothetical protein